MQIKTTTMAYLATVRTSIINESSNNTWWRGPGEKESLQGAGGMKLQTAPKQNSTQVPERKTKLPMNQQSMPKRISRPNQNSKRNMHQICSALPVTTAKIWKQTAHPHECIKGSGYTSTGNMTRS